LRLLELFERLPSELGRGDLHERDAVRTRLAADRHLKPNDERLHARNGRVELDLVTRALREELERRSCPDGVRAIRDAFGEDAARRWLLGELVRGDLSLAGERGSDLTHLATHGRRLEPCVLGRVRRRRGPRGLLTSCDSNEPEQERRASTRPKGESS
jgi:hypothetical protein